MKSGVNERYAKPRVISRVGKLPTEPGRGGVCQKHNHGEDHINTFEHNFFSSFADLAPFALSGFFHH
jgi:hypothetical protein